ncbi:MAG TPA: radical SAM protein [Candidatus Paceibacterota bacterium]|nr:radical SAM protein [Candidatus Paceibacterota bacterium]
MKKVLLVNPPFYRLLGSHYNGNPSGIAYIASTLNKNGYDAWIYNADFIDKKEYANLKNIFENSNNYKQYFKNTNHPIWKEVTEKIISFNPDWVGYTCYTANIKTIDIISRKIKQRNNRIKQIVGGAHATLDHNILDKMPAINYAVSRDGEVAVLELISGNNPLYIKGLIFKDKGKTIDNGHADTVDYNSIPFPERDKFWTIKEGEKEQVDISYVSTIRGCPYQCSFCASPQCWKGSKTQFRSTESILSELVLIKEKYWNKNSQKYDFSASSNSTSKNKLIIKDNSVVYFVDDAFTSSKKRTVELLSKMIKNKLNMPWKCEARADNLDDEICSLMKKSGCIRIKVGFESGSNHILKLINKRETKEQMKRAANLIKKYNIPFTAYFMTGFPKETDNDLQETIDFAKEIKPDFYSLSILAPYFGTKIYYDLQEQGYHLEKYPWEYFYHQTGDLMVNDCLSKELVKKFLSLNDWNKENNSKGYI